MTVGHLRHKFQTLIDFGGRYIYHDSHADTAHNRICSQQMDITARDHLLKMVGIMVSFMFAITGPAYAYFVNGEKTTTTDIHFPFLKSKSNAEYIANIAFAGLFATHGLLVYIGFEIYFTLFQNVVSIAPKLVKHELDESIQLFHDKAISEAALCQRIAHIARKSCDTDKYAQNT